MVGCTILTHPPPCASGLESLWWLPSLRPFKLGPFSSEEGPQHVAAWASPATLFWPNDVFVDVEIYSLVLLLCDLLLTCAWHHATKYVVTRRQFRLRFLSPSMRFTFGVIFGAVRLWLISHLRPTALYFFLARLTFVVYLILGLSALVFDDGPWRNVRPNARSAWKRDSLLNPYGAIHKALNSNVTVTKLTLARPAVRRNLENGNTVTIVLDQSGSLLFAKRGRLEIRDAVQMRVGGRCIIELVARKENCKSGTRDFFGYVFGAPFQHHGIRSMTPGQKSALLDLLLGLNDCTSLLPGRSTHIPISSALLRPCIKWFQVPHDVARAMRERELAEEAEMEEIDGGAMGARGILSFYK